MPYFRVLMTRDTTESASVVVKARSKADAWDIARQMHDRVDWETDDNYRDSGDVYLGGGLNENVERVNAPPSGTGGEPTNADRARWAAMAIDPFARETFHKGFKALIEGDQEDCIADLVCDLLHLARTKGFDTEALLSKATGNFEAEVAYEQA